MVEFSWFLTTFSVRCGGALGGNRRSTWISLMVWHCFGCEQVVAMVLSWMFE